MRKFRAIQIAALSVATLAAIAVPGSSAQAAPSPGNTSVSISKENPALIKNLKSHGGRVSADRRWVSMPSGVQISLVPMALSDCPTNWLCLWANASYGGRMLKWSDPGTRDDLSAYGFNDQMTSWANKTNYGVKGH